MKHWKKKPWVDSEVRNWDYIADHIAPDATSADAGKVLTVGETGKPEWGEGGGSGGGVLMAFEPDEINDRMISNFSVEDFIEAVNNHVPIYVTLDNLNFYILEYVGYDSTEEESDLNVYGGFNRISTASATQVIIEMSEIYYSADDQLFIYETQTRYVTTGA